MGKLEDFIRQEMTNHLDKTFAALPWWCLLCGEGGNYEGERPDEYWFPPENHVCKQKQPPSHEVVMQHDASTSMTIVRVFCMSEVVAEKEFSPLEGIDGKHHLWLDQVQREHVHTCPQGGPRGIVT
jgi:hypothetical protein